MDLRVISYKKIPNIGKCYLQFIFKWSLGVRRGRGHSVNKAKVYLKYTQKNISILLLNLQKCLIIIIIIMKALCSLSKGLQMYKQIKDCLQQTHLVHLFWPSF